MGNNPGHEWLRGLDEIEHAIGACLSTLDHREARVAELFPDHGRPIRDVARLLDSQSLATGWAERLAKANAYAEQAESLLQEVKVHWDQWREALTTWQRLVEHLPTNSADTQAVFEAIANVTNHGHHPGGR